MRGSLEIRKYDLLVGCCFRRERQYSAPSIVGGGRRGCSVVNETEPKWAEGSPEEKDRRKDKTRTGKKKTSAQKTIVWQPYIL
jgi:hypothetical protein